MLTVSVAFINYYGKYEETQFDIEESNYPTREWIDLFNVVLSRKEELDIVEICSVDFAESEE